MYCIRMDRIGYLSNCWCPVVFAVDVGETIGDIYIVAELCIAYHHAGLIRYDILLANLITVLECSVVRVVVTDEVDFVAGRKRLCGLCYRLRNIV